MASVIGGTMFKRSKKYGTKKKECPWCKGSGIRDFCGKCGSEIFRYENGVPLCQSCHVLLVGKEVRW